MSEFSNLSDDVVLKIFFKLEDDPRNWCRLACVSPKFLSLIENVCCKSKTYRMIFAAVNDLLPGSVPSANYWSSMLKLSVCCPGLLHGGVLLENSDFVLERELGPEESFPCSSRLPDTNHSHLIASSSGSKDDSGLNVSDDCYWTLFDDLMFDTVYDASETSLDPSVVVDLQSEHDEIRNLDDSSTPERRKKLRFCRSHLASGVWTLSREEGSKLLASQFKGDCLYICDWPGCLHMEENRNYMLFRGIFKDFKQSRVWRTIKDGNKCRCTSKVDLNCAFCSCTETYDLHSAFCLRSYFGYHDDGEPVVRAYVCENGHVSGAWTDQPLSPV